MAKNTRSGPQNRTRSQNAGKNQSQSQRRKQSAGRGRGKSSVRLPGIVLLLILLLWYGGNNFENFTPEEIAPAIENALEMVMDLAGDTAQTATRRVKKGVSLGDLPAYNGSPYVVIGDNTPDFDEIDMTTASFEEYSPLDSLGRCGVTYANIGRDLMPTEKRGSIGSVKPTGWHSTKYDWVDGKHLYNRCHLIGYQLTAENANERNLITGTRYLNVDGMLPFENMVADYVKETGNHVLYRVTPDFEGDNLVANGVLMEAMSVEDKGAGVCFEVYCYNVQPGVTIDYATGDSWKSK